MQKLCRVLRRDPMSQSSDDSKSGAFPTTQWTLILDQIQKGDEAAAWQALGQFCELYRPAVYNFFRRRGCEHQLAEDHAQEFFTTRIHKRWSDREGFLFSAQRRPQSRFRVFLATVLRAFLIDKWRVKPKPHDHAADADVISQLEALPDPNAAGFEKEFDRAFALETIHRAIAAAKASPYHVAHLKGEMSQAEAAAALGISSATFRVSYLRFRARLKEELWALVSKLIEARGQDKEVEAEIRYLMSLFARAAS